MDKKIYEIVVDLMEENDIVISTTEKVSRSAEYVLFSFTPPLNIIDSKNGSLNAHSSIFNFNCYSSSVIGAVDLVDKVSSLMKTLRSIPGITTVKISRARDLPKFNNTESGYTFSIEVIHSI